MYGIFSWMRYWGDQLAPFHYRHVRFQLRANLSTVCHFQHNSNAIWYGWSSGGWPLRRPGRSLAL